MSTSSPKLDEVIYFLMDKALRASRKHSIKVFKENNLDISLDQWVVMRRIYEEKSQTQIELARATYKDAASITRILDLLHNKNMVRRIPNETDRRKSCLILTKKGTDTINSAYAVVAELRAEGLDGISNEELQTAKRVMNKIAQNMKTT